MYDTINVVQKIKILARQKEIKVTEMLEECGLSKNALSSMNSRGSWIQANSLAKIADYLNCSVDYLLGRTDNSERYSGDNITIGDTNGNYNMTIAKGESKQLQIDGLSKEMLEKFDALDFDKKVEVMALIADLSKK